MSHLDVLTCHNPRDCGARGVGCGAARTNGLHPRVYRNINFHNILLSLSRPRLAVQRGPTVKHETGASTQLAMRLVFVQRFTRVQHACPAVSIARAGGAIANKTGRSKPALFSALTL